MRGGLGRLNGEKMQKICRADRQREQHVQRSRGRRAIEVSEGD